MDLRSKLRPLFAAWLLTGLMVLAAAQPTTGTLAAVPGELKIRPGDVLALAYVFDVPDPALPYRVETGDLINLFLPYSPETLSFDEYTVPPDGQVAFRGTDEPIAVAGRTAQEIVAELKLKYAPVFSDPKINFNVTPSYQKSQTLRRLFQAESKKEPEHVQSFMRLPVPADHLLSLPLLDRIVTQGLSVADLGRVLTARYRELGFRDLTISVWYDQLSTREVSVLGEVRTPGAVSVGGGARLWDAVAKAGGATGPSASVQALVIDSESTPSRRTFSLRDYLATADPAHNPPLRGGELISVGGNP